MRKSRGIRRNIRNTQLPYMYVSSSMVGRKPGKQRRKRKPLDVSPKALYSAGKHEGDMFSDNTEPRDISKSTHIGLPKDVNELLKPSGSVAQFMFDALAECSPIGIFRTDTSGRLDYCNTQMCELVGVEKSKLIGSSWNTWMHADDVGAFHQRWLECMSAQACCGFKLRFCRGGETPRWVEIRTTPLKDASGTVVGCVGCALDVSEKHQAEMALQGVMRASYETGREFFRALVRELSRTLHMDRVCIGLFLDKPAPRIRTLAIHGADIPCEDQEYLVAGKPMEGVIAAAGHEPMVIADDVQKVFPTDPVLRQIGARSYIAAPLKLTSGRCLGVIQMLAREPIRFNAFARSILSMFAARALAELERWRLNRSHDQLLTSLGAATDFAAACFADGSVCYMNEAGRKMLGIPLGEDLAHLRISDTHPPEEADRIARVALPTAVAKGVWSGETTFVARDGRRINTSQVIFSHKDHSGVVESFFTVARDITEAKMTHGRMELLDAALSAAAQAIAITDKAGVIMWVNRSFCELTGYRSEELIGHSVTMLWSGQHPPQFYSDLWSTILGGRVWRGEVYSRKKDGSIYVEELTITPVRPEGGEVTHFITVKQSLEERREMERRVLRAQRLESLGTLAAGVAHDLNNALAPVLMGASIIRSELPPKLESILDTMESSARRGADMVRQLLTFARGAEGKPVVIQPRYLLREMERFVTRTFPKEIQVRFDVHPELRNIRVSGGMKMQ